MALFKKSSPALAHGTSFDLHRTLPNPVYPATDAPDLQPTPKRSWKKIIKRCLLVLLVLAIGVGGWLGWKIYQNSDKIFGGNPLSLLQQTKLKGEETGRVNILLIGNSADDPGHAGASLTDSIMLVSIDTTNNKAVLISIPRDLYVNIPGKGYAKINEAYQNGGASTLESVVESRLGISVNYYALINYTAFRDTVNALGGITVNIESSDARGLYDPNIAKVDGGPLKLANGSQTLDGQTALNLARARGDNYYAYGFPNSDFDRTTHQRQMLIALKDKATSTSTLANPLKISSLLDALGNNVTTDMTAAEARRLYDISKKIDTGAIASATINGTTTNRLLTSYTTRTGQSALVPKAGLDDYTAIQNYVQSLLSGN